MLFCHPQPTKMFIAAQAEAEERSEMGPVVRSLMRPLETALDNCDRILRQRAEREAARERKKAAAKANGASRKRALPAS